MPLWNGSTFIYTQCPQLQNVLANSAVGNAGPAAVAASTAYDLFIWSNAGTPTLTRGPAWANSTPGSGSRGTGAGTTELATVQGLRVNAQAIANGPAAGFGTYVGSFATDGSGTLTYQSGYTQASGGFQGNVSVWNTFNRIDVTSGTGDTTASWTYASTAYRMQNNSAGNRLNFMVGLQEDQLFAIKEQMMSATGSAVANIALGLNSTTAKYAACNTGRNGNTSGVVTGCAFNVWPAIGPNYIQALELAESGTATFYGFGGSGFWQDLTMMRWRA
jgi:hypothetical protein